MIACDETIFLKEITKLRFKNIMRANLVIMLSPRKTLKSFASLFVGLGSLSLTLLNRAGRWIFHFILYRKL